MVTNPPEKHLTGLLCSAGRALAKAPAAKATVRNLQAIRTSEAFASFLETVDLGLAPPATDLIRSAAADAAIWQDTYTTMLRSAEQQLIERFSASS